MGRKCCIPTCRSGYAGEDKNIPVSFFKFPVENYLKEKWVRAIPRKD
jgi:hypothetical protein